MTSEQNSSLTRAERLIEAGEFAAAREVLRPLIEIGVGKAVRLNCSIFEEGVSEDEMDRIYSEGILRAAELGDLEALYISGSFYDQGEYVPQDKEKASAIFRQAAELGHSHSQWIYACELLWGKGTFPQSIERGLDYLQRAIDNGSAEACITKARLYHEGEFGHSKNPEQVASMCQLARDYDETVFVPYT